MLAVARTSRCRSQRSRYHEVDPQVQSPQPSASGEFASMRKMYLEQRWKSLSDSWDEEDRYAGSDRKNLSNWVGARQICVGSRRVLKYRERRDANAPAR